MAKKILIVEDEKELSKIMKDYFSHEGYEVYQAYDGDEALKIYNETLVDLITLDIMLPKISGYEVLKIIRSSSNVPIIMISALDSDENIIKGYENYVDDYITKPFNPRILLLKVNNLFKKLSDNQKTEYVKGNIRLNFQTHTVTKDLETLNLSKTEFDILALLIKHENEVCSRVFILDEVWGLNSFVEDRIIDTYIKKLRKELKPYNYIKTIFKSGYMFSLEDE